MTNQGITGVNVFSSVTNLPIGEDPIAIITYAETLLLKDYNDQLKDHAQGIKISTSLKAAYRNHKMKINDILNKEQKDGKIKLTAAEYNLLNSRPDFRYDPDLYGEGMGGVRDYSNDRTDIFAITNNGYAEVNFDNEGNPVAANQTAGWWGDPHFSDADGNGGTDWDFQGLAGQTYNYLSDSNLNFNATHEAWGGGGTTVVGSADITVNGPQGDSKIVFDADGSPTLDGVAMEVGRTYELEDGGEATYDGTTLQAKTAEGYTISLEDKGGYLNGSVQTGGKGVMSDGNASTGVIGQQFDANTNKAFENNQEAENANKAFAMNNAVGQINQPKTYDVEVDRIKAVMDQYQMKLDGLNSESELVTTELGTLSSQRNTVNQSVANMLSKQFDTIRAILNKG